MTRKLGFTMVEMLMVMGLMAFLVVILSGVFGAILTMKLRSHATTAVAQDTRYLLARLSYDIARSSDISVPSVTSLLLTIGGNSYLYSLSGTTLVLSVEGGEAQAMTSIGTQISSLSFTKFADIASKESVQISLSLAPTILQSGGATGERQLTTTIATR